MIYNHFVNINNLKCRAILPDIAIVPLQGTRSSETGSESLKPKFEFTIKIDHSTSNLKAFFQNQLSPTLSHCFIILFSLPQNPCIKVEISNILQFVYNFIFW